MPKLFGGNNEQNVPTPHPQPPQQQPESIQVPDEKIPTKKKNKSMMEFSSFPRLQMFLRIYCSIAALGMSVLASYAVSMPRGCLDPYFYLISCWLVLLGIISILVEWRINRVRSLFAFLTYKTGRGFFYIFIGSLCTGISEVYGIIVGAIVILGGILTIIIAIFLRKQKNKPSLAGQDQLNMQNTV